MFNQASLLAMHLMDDGFCANNVSSLAIIDDYHTKRITDEATDFYVEAFRNTGIRTIDIYYQIKSKVNPKYKTDVRLLADSIHEPVDLVVAFLVFVLNSLNLDIFRSLRSKYLRGEIDDIVQTTVSFVQKMQLANISVFYHPYQSFDFYPPFHGRYWLNENEGYIVDASLNTYSHDRVFAQLMDDENYMIIKDLFDNEIIPRSSDYSVITAEILTRMSPLVRDDVLNNFAPVLYDGFPAL